MVDILVVAPHFDDETIGCGGLLAKRSAQGKTTAVMFVTDGSLGYSQNTLPYESTRRNEATAACKCLGVSELHFLDFPERDFFYSRVLLAKMVTIFLEMSPTEIYIPYAQDADREHQTVANLASDALWMAVDNVFGHNQNCLYVMPSVFEYEVWTPFSDPQLFFPIDDVIEQKLTAMAQYESQLSQRNYCDAIRGLNNYRGIMGDCNSRYAEAYRIKRFSFLEKGQRL